LRKAISVEAWDVSLQLVSPTSGEVYTAEWVFDKTVSIQLVSPTSGERFGN
jgi:hypothetical protein